MILVKKGLHLAASAGIPFKLFKYRAIPKNEKRTKKNRLKEDKNAVIKCNIIYNHSKITALWCHLVSSLFLSPRSTLQARCEATKRTQNIQSKNFKKLVRSDQHISHSISQPTSHLVNLLTSIIFHHDPSPCLILGLPFGVLALEVPQLTLLRPSSNPQRHLEL